MGGLLQGKVAVVTGAGRGVGRAECLAFARQGAKVVAADLDPGLAELTAGRVREEGGEAIARACDAADKASVEALIAAAVEAYGRLDIVANNAGINLRPRQKKAPSRRGDAAEAGFAPLYAISVDGLRGVCEAAIAQFEAQDGGGAIVNSDLTSRLRDYGGVNYDPNKGPVGRLTKSLAVEAAEHGIRINSFYPAGRASSFRPELADEDADAPEDNPLGVPITSEDCANAALFLASDLARTIAGINLPVDGGLAAKASLRR